MKKTLSVFSYLFHPLFIPVFAVLFYFMLNENYFSLQQKYLIVFQICVLTILIPICFYFLLRSLGKIDSIMIAEISQRKLPLLIQAILLFTLIQKSISIDQIFELYFFFIGALISTLLALALSLGQIRASLHLMGVSSLTVFVIGLSFHNQVNVLFTIGFLVLLNGIIASSRLVMKAHTMTELGIGFCCGVIPQLALLYFWL